MQVNPDALRFLIEKDGYSISDFARDAQVERSHLSNILAGRRGASPATVKRMAQTLNVTISAITIPVALEDSIPA